MSDYVFFVVKRIPIVKCRISVWNLHWFWSGTRTLWLQLVWMLWSRFSKSRGKPQHNISGRDIGKYTAETLNLDTSIIWYVPCLSLTLLESKQLFSESCFMLNFKGVIRVYSVYSCDVLFDFRAEKLEVVCICSSICWGEFVVVVVIQGHSFTHFPICLTHETCTMEPNDHQISLTLYNMTRCTIHWYIMRQSSSSCDFLSFFAQHLRQADATEFSALLLDWLQRELSASWTSQKVFQFV